MRKTCPNCGYENKDTEECVICGEKLYKEETNQSNDIPLKQKENNNQNQYEHNQQNNNFNNYSNNQNKNNINFKPNNNNPNSNNNNRNYTQNNNPNFNTNYKNNKPNNHPQNSHRIQQYHQKNKTVGFIIGLVLPGVGYCYIDQWEKGIILFLSAFICFLLQWLIFPIIILIGIWIYSLVDVDKKIDLYNRGLPF